MKINGLLGKCSILVAPNEDGFGPSTFAFYIVKELINQWDSLRDPSPELQTNERYKRLKKKWPNGFPELSVIFRIWGKTSYINSLFSKEINAGIVTIEKIDNIIRLGKRRGQLGFENSLDNLLAYPRLSKIYQKLPFPSNCIGAIDIGVPQVAATAKRLGIPAVTVFDHSWGRSMAEIFNLFAKTERYSKGGVEPSDSVSHAINLVCEHEAASDIVFLFPTYIAPEEYYRHWRELGVTINELGGVLGGQPYVIDGHLEEQLGGRESCKTIKHQTYEAFKYALEKNLEGKAFTEDVIHRISLPLEKAKPANWPTEIRELIKNVEEEQRAQVAMGLADGKGEAAFRRTVAKQFLLNFPSHMKKPIVYVSGGGTPVWDEILEKLVKAAIDKEKNDRLKFAIVLSYFPDEFKEWPKRSGNEAERIRKKFIKFGIDKLKNPKKNDKPIEMRIPVFNNKELESIRFVRDIESGTHQEIFYGIDLIVTRAGGGTANDSIATRTPLLCVEEPGHWQVEAIRRNLTNQGFARSVTLEAFRNNPLGVIEHELIDEREQNEKLRRRLYSVKNRTEEGAAQTILKLFLDPESYYDDLVRELIFH